MKKSKIESKILELKENLNVLILAHYYQNDDIQKIADITGDSLELSKKAAITDKDIILFCGVQFMSETAKILSPDKTVLTPVKNAGCPLAEQVDEKRIDYMRAKHPDAKVVCYINSSAKVKAKSDICCTSSNAVKVVQNLDSEKIIFTPDNNLANYVASQVRDKQIISSNGYCPIHHNISLEQVEKVKEKHPDALLLMHPECNKKLLFMADFIGSTSQIINYASSNNSTQEFIIGTEMGILYSLKKHNPNKVFHMLSKNMVCKDMKKITLQDVLLSLQEKRYKVELDENTRKKAFNALDKMLKI